MSVGSYKHSNKNSTRQQQYYTPAFVLKEARTTMEKYLPQNVTCLLDMGAGDGSLGDLLLESDKWTSVISIDSDPQWNKPQNMRHRKVKGDALKFILPEGFCTENVVVGFNPPYGLRNRFAKFFIEHAYSLRAPYSCWLIPQVATKFVKQFYDILYRKDYYNFTFFSFAGNTTPNPQWVSLILGKRRPEPIPYKLKLQGGYVRMKFPEETNLVVRIIGGKTPFPFFVKENTRWFMYNYVNDKNKAFETIKVLVKKATKKAQKSYKMESHVVMKYKTKDYVVGGNAFVKIHAEKHQIATLVKNLLQMAKDHVDKLKFRREEKKRVAHMNAIEKYQHMNNVYNNRSTIEKYYTSHQPQTWNPETIIQLMN